MLLQIRYITKLHDFTTCTAMVGLMSHYSSRVIQPCTSWWTINFSLHVVSVHKESSASRPFPVICFVVMSETGSWQYY